MTDDHTHRGDDVHSVEAVEREANGGWQPIETAPRDGTEVVGMWMYGGANHCIMVWKLDKWCRKFNVNYSYTPTHWMPLPAAPTEGEL
jgi:hypothetical protein